METRLSFLAAEHATPIEDCSELLLSWVQDMKDLNRAEAENILGAQRKYLRFSSSEISTWFNPKELQSIHRLMFGKVWGWAGKGRKSITSIGIAPGYIPMRMAELCKEVNSWSSEPVELTFLEKSARIHHRLVLIHPFENGNGRFSRMVADRYLLCWKCQHPIWPEDLQQNGSARKNYILTLQAADRGDYEPLMFLMKQLGAKEPDLKTFFQDGIYKRWLGTAMGLAKIKAFLRAGENPSKVLSFVIKTKWDEEKKYDWMSFLKSRGATV